VAAGFPANDMIFALKHLLEGAGKGKVEIQGQEWGRNSQPFSFF